MGTFAIDLLSGKQFIFNKTFGTSSGGTTTPVWGGIGGIITNQVDLMNYFDTKVSNNVFTGYTATTDSRIYNIELSKTDNSLFSGYTANTKTILDNLNTNKLENSIFTGYTATTDSRINALVNDYNYYNTESNILALDPSFSGYVNQKIWATDTKREYLSQYVQTIGGYRWLDTSLLYNPITDSYYIGETADNQTLNLGQEIFLNIYNTTTTNATSLNPKVFLSVNANTFSDDFMNAVLARADDISDGSTYGLNTTNASASTFFKMTTYGLLHNVDTSSWPVGTELYIDSEVRGNLTSIKPETNANFVGFVIKQDSTNGIIFVNTISGCKGSDTTSPVSYDYSYFNADLVTTSAGTFYLNLRNNKGTITGATQTVIVPDNTIVGVTRDSLSIVFPTDNTYNQGSYQGKFEVSVNISQGNEKIYLEVYKADQYGNVVDSGISGEIIGDLGVKPFLVLSSTLLDLQPNTVTAIIVDGVLRENATILTNQRFRFHIKCEKIGTAGGDKTFTIHYGTTYDTWLRFPHYMVLDELYDVVTYNASAGTFLKKNGNGIWTGQYLQHSDIKTSITIVSGSSYSATTNDYIIGVISTTGNSVNIYLPSISGASKIILIIKDQGFNSAINNINIIPIDGNKIENNLSSVSIGINGGSITIYNDGNNNWFII